MKNYTFQIYYRTIILLDIFLMTMLSIKAYFYAINALKIWKPLKSLRKSGTENISTGMQRKVLRKMLYIININYKISLRLLT